MTSLSAVTCSEAPAGVLVLDWVRCARCGGQGREAHFFDQPKPTCSRCDAWGVVRPQASVGQRIAVVVDGLLVGTVTATTEALPIVDIDASVSGPCLLVDRRENGLWLCPDGRNGKWVDLSHALPSLPDDLVGRWAVLVGREDDEDNLSGCPYYARYQSFPGHDPEATCSFGCSDEPACVTCEPLDGWPFVRFPKPLPVPDPGPPGVLWTLDLAEVGR